MNCFPFSAILGQEHVKTALLLNAVNPNIGGVLIRGEKGTGKSTIARGFAEILPKIEIVEGCSFGCDPGDVSGLCDDCDKTLRTKGKLPTVLRRTGFVNFPLNATEEMITGTLDLKTAVLEGTRQFQLGLLGRANRGFLYIDEVNLLEDHLIDIVLDTAASGINIVEREGISIHHPASFTPIGSMNPEEGELRPQFLDRFGFCVEINGIHDPNIRVELMTKKEAFDENPKDFTASFAAEEEALKNRIDAARRLLPSVTMPSELIGFISELCIQNKVKGHRADIVMYRGAGAYAALHGRAVVERKDIQYVARFVFSHRSELDKICDHSVAEEEVAAPRETDRTEETEKVSEVRKTSELQGTPEEEDSFPSLKNSENEKSKDKDRIIVDKEEVFQIGQIFPIKKIPSLHQRRTGKQKGKRETSKSSLREGRYIRSRPARELRDIAFDATLRAAAPFQPRRKGESPLACIIRPEDVYEKVRAKKIGNLFLFILDASGSMGAHRRMIATKGAIFSLLMDAYQKRDKAAMVTFQKKEALCILPPTASIDLAGKLLKNLPVGGRTPLSHGLLKGYSVLRNYLIKDPESLPIVVLITDGKANIPLHGDDPFQEALTIAAMMARHPKTSYIVVDTLEPRQANLGTAYKLSRALDAEYFKIEDLKTSDLVRIARSTTQ